MKHYSDQELNAKIHGFMNRKMGKFPELHRERYYIEAAPQTKPDRVNRGQLFSFFHLNVQY